MSGGSPDWSATGILVLNCSFWIGTGLTVTSGCDLWKSSATFCQNAFWGPTVALCHQTSVTLSLLAFAPTGFACAADRPPETPRAAITPTSSAQAFHRRIIRVFLPPHRGGR